MSGKKRGYHHQAVKRHYGGALRRLSHSQLFRQRGLWGVKLGPANRGRRLDAGERQAIEPKNAGWGAALLLSAVDLCRKCCPFFLSVDARGRQIAGDIESNRLCRIHMLLGRSCRQTIAIGGGMFAIECDRLIVVRDGRVVIGSIAVKDTFFEKRIATIGVSLWILRFQLDY